MATGRDRYGRSIKFYEKMSSLHSQLKNYEEDQKNLEDEFGRLWSQMPMGDGKLKKSFETRGRRNEAILAKVQELESNASLFAARAERLRLLRTEYETLLRKYTPKHPVDLTETSGQSLGETSDERKFALFPSTSSTSGNNIGRMRSTMISTGVNTDISGPILAAPENECKKAFNPNPTLFPQNNNGGNIYPDFSISETTTTSLTTSAAEESEAEGKKKHKKDETDDTISEMTSMSRPNLKLFESDESTTTTAGKKIGIKNLKKPSETPETLLSESEATFEEEDETSSMQKHPGYFPRDEDEVENEAEDENEAESVIENEENDGENAVKHQISNKNKSDDEDEKENEKYVEESGNEPDVVVMTKEEKLEVMINEEGEAQRGKEDPSKISPSRTPPEFLDGNETQMIAPSKLQTETSYRKEPNDGDSQMIVDEVEDVREEKGDEEEKEKPSLGTDLIKDEKKGKRLKLKVDYEDSESSELSENPETQKNERKPKEKDKDLDDFFDD